jgi:hypothetical protein
METARPSDSQGSGKTSSGELRESLAEAVRFWEPRRLVYNLVLAGVAVEWIVATWPHFRPAFTLISFLQLSVLALLANVCYCAAYLVDIPIRRSNAGATCNTFRQRGRWGLWLLGTLLAVVLENYWISDEIYPFVR